MKHAWVYWGLRRRTWNPLRARLIIEGILIVRNGAEVD